MLALDGLSICPAAPADAPATLALVAEAGLPVADLDAADVSAFLVARDAGALVGTVAVEAAGDDGLLRSLAVAPAWRGRGIGRRLVDAAEARATADGLRRLVLLTTTAAPFFEARGYAPVDRASLPEALRRHPQVAALCSASASCLARALG